MTSAYLSPVVPQTGDILSIIRAKLLQINQVFNGCSAYQPSRSFELMLFVVSDAQFVEVLVINYSSDYTICISFVGHYLCTKESSGEAVCSNTGAKQVYFDSASLVQGQECRQQNFLLKVEEGKYAVYLVAKIMPHDTNPSSALRVDMIWVDPMSLPPKTGKQPCPGQGVLLSVDKRERQTWKYKEPESPCFLSRLLTGTIVVLSWLDMLVKVKSSRGFAIPANVKKLGACLLLVGKCCSSHVNI